MLRILLALVRPLAQIAKELRVIRELYEMELESRQPPIYRVTEKPSKHNTEISYTGVRDERPIYKRWFGPADVEEDEED